MSDRKFWNAVLEKLRSSVSEDEFRRYFGESMQASDSGDMVSVWVPSETIKRHILSHYQDVLDRALSALNRSDVEIRLIATGVGEDEDGEDE
jgi:chromosomal replication initiation ATPase DnaA